MADSGKRKPESRRTITLNDLDVMPALPLAPKGSDDWATARYYASAAEGFSQASVVAQIMCGFELIELQKRMALGRGGDRRSKPNDSVLIGDGSKPSDLVLSWPKLVKAKIGKSDETARTWMNMARAMKPRLKKLDGPWEAPALLALPVSEWPEEARAAVGKILQKITDGMTQADFMKELGIAKKAHGHAIAKGNGGYHPNAAILRVWLGEQYPDQPEWLGLDFAELPAEVQKRVRAEMRRYEERLSPARKAEIEWAEDARVWNAAAPGSILKGLDAGYYMVATPEQRVELITATKDFLRAVEKFHADSGLRIGGNGGLRIADTGKGKA